MDRRQIRLVSRKSFSYVPQLSILPNTEGKRHLASEKADVSSHPGESKEDQVILKPDSKLLIWCRQ